MMATELYFGVKRPLRRVRLIGDTTAIRSGGAGRFVADGACPSAARKAAGAARSTTGVANLAREILKDEFRGYLSGAGVKFDSRRLRRDGGGWWRRAAVEADALEELLLRRHPNGAPLRRVRRGAPKRGLRQRPPLFVAFNRQPFWPWSGA
jgi:hypothetical protein